MPVSRRAVMAGSTALPFLRRPARGAQSLRDAPSTTRPSAKQSTATYSL
jgi:hypothetical protein